MIAPSTLLVFLPSAWALILLPGPDVLYVLARGMAGGRRAGIVSALAIGSGEVVHTLLVTAGLAGVLAGSVRAFLVIKYAGAAYLLWLGIRLLRNPHPLPQGGPGAPAPLIHVYRQGILTNLLNPQAIVFYAAFLPQFVDPTRGAAATQVMILGALFGLSDVVYLLALAYAAGYVDRRLSGSARLPARLRRFAGGVLVGLGIRVALTARG